MSSVKHQHGPADPACLEIFEKLSEYLDGELSPLDCAQVKEHIADCEPCIAFLESLKTSIRASQELHPHEPVRELPAEAKERLKAAWKAALERRAG